jgi:Bacteriophage clamp loader A subunit
MWMKFDLFKELIPHILEGKEFTIEDDDYKTINSFLLNQALSYHLDCIFLVAEMNKNYHLDKKLQYDFLNLAIKKKKRKFQSWVKTTKDENIEIIKKYFGYSTNKALEIINILSENDIQMMKDSMDTGGSENAKTKRKNG